MIPRIDPSPELLALAELQGGVLTVEQTRGLGLGRHPVSRLVAEGRWQRLDSGLYLADRRTPDWLALAWGGVLLGGASARLGGAAAGYLQGLNDHPDPLIEVLVPWTRVLAPRGCWRFAREREGVRSNRSLGSPPRLGVEDTVLDLTQDLEPGDVIGLVTRAVQQRRTTPRRLRARLLARGRLRHRRLLLSLLDDVAEGAETPLELRYLHDVERDHQLPRGVRQHRTGRSGHIRDVLYEEFQTVVELDGRLGHEGLGRFRDMHRDNLGVLSGEVTLRYGWLDVTHRPCAAAFQVGGVLARRGWADVPSRCWRCRHADLDVYG